MKNTVLMAGVASLMLISQPALAVVTVSSISCAADTVTVTVAGVDAATSLSVGVTTSTLTNTFDISNISPNAGEITMAFENDSQLLGTVDATTSFAVSVGGATAVAWHGGWHDKFRSVCWRCHSNLSKL